MFLGYPIASSGRSKRQKHEEAPPGKIWNRHRHNGAGHLLPIALTRSNPDRPRLDGPVASGVFGVALSTIVCASVFWHGVPALRHDWRIPINPSAAGSWLSDYFQPWVSSGIGTANPYPTLYWFAALLWPFHTAGPLLLLMVVAVGTTLLTTQSTFSLGASIGAPIVYRVSAACVAALNPWVYSKYVAGQIFMVADYAIILALISEMVRSRPRERFLMILAALSITQIQFFCIIAPFFLIWCIKRRFPRPGLVMLISATPIVLGIVLRFRDVASIPYTLFWQKAASVPVASGALMLGYEFHYASVFDVLRPAIGCLAAAAAIGLSLSSRRSAMKSLVFLALAALAFASGLDGPIAPLYRWIVVSIPESGLFRELYDLIAIVAVAYIVGLLALGALRPPRFVSVLIAIAAISLAWPWFSKPVWSFAVAGASIPRTLFPRNDAYRVALFPALQPLMMGGRGSGFDPDSFPQDEAATPINTFLPTYPVNAALGQEWLNRNDRMLEALAVRTIIVRPYLETDWRALSYTIAGLPAPPTLPKARSNLKAISLISITPGLPRITDDPQNLIANAIFIGDTIKALPETLTAPFGKNLDLRRRWVPLSLAATMHPEWATKYGGVATQGSKPFQLPGARALLASISGTLTDDRGRIVIRSQDPRLRWYSIPPQVHSVRCEGTCALVFASKFAAPKDINKTGATKWASVPFRTLSPWAYTVQIGKSGSFRTLRVSTRYTPYWTAFQFGETLTHVNLNSVLNGFIIPPSASGTVLVLETAAFVQFVCEWTAIICILLLVIWPRPHSV